MNRNLFALVALVACSFGCRTAHNGNQIIPSPATGETIISTEVSTRESDIPVSEFLRQLPLVEKGKKAGMLPAWNAIPNYDHYRKARASDFAMAGWNDKEFDRSYEYGEIAGAYGLATFVIDKTIPKPRHSSFVVFIERPGDRYDIYWIYRDQNLSGFNLSRSSGDIFLGGGSARTVRMQVARLRGTRS